jgi:hypothetical protein
VDRLGRRALIVGAAALLALAVVGLATGGPQRVWGSYLAAFVFWIGVALGSLALVMLHQLSGGEWGVVIRRPAESAARTLPLMALLFLPVAFALPRIYAWARPEAVAASAALQHKAPYLNPGFFLARTGLYLTIWIALAYLLDRGSRAQDRTGDPRAGARLRTLSGPGLVLYALTVSFASFDWVMSLDAEWFSTIFGVLAIGGQGLSALAFMVAVLVPLSAREPLTGRVRPMHLHDLGKLMLAFVMLWAYFNFSQLIIIWSGNLPEEIPWYVRRLHGGWSWVGLGLILFHFVLPFLLLLSRDLKRRPGSLVAVAVALLVMRAVDTVWLVAPELEPLVAPALGVAADVLALAGVGGIWVWFFLRQLERRPRGPRHDPALETRPVRP